MLPMFLKRTCGPGNEEVDLAIPLDEGPDAPDGRAQLLVGLVHLVHGADEDAEVDADEGEERRGEVNLALLVDGHVHADETLVGEEVGALVAEAERGVDLLEQGEHVRVVDLPAAKRRNGEKIEFGDAVAFRIWKF